MVSQELLQSNLASGNKPFVNFDPTIWANLKTAINLFTSQSVYCAIAIHGGADPAFGAFNGVKYTAFGGSNSGSGMADFWQRIAEEYKASAYVGYSINNEPLLGSSGVYSWWDTAQKCINAIRRTGSGQVIFVPGISYTGASQWSNTPYTDPSGSGITNATAWLTLTDPCDNLVAEIHEYFSAEDSGAVETNVAPSPIGSTRLAPVISWANANSKRFIVGEFGCNTTLTNGTAVVNDFVSTIKANSKIGKPNGYCTGAWWWTYAPYPFFNSYAYTLTKQSAAPPSGTDSTNMTNLVASGFFTAPTAPPVFNPLTDLPNKYAFYNPSTASISAGLLVSLADSSGLAADSTKTLVPKTTGWDSAPEYTAANALLNNLPSISNSNASASKAMTTQTLTTAISATSTYYLVAYVDTLSPTSTVYLRGSADLTASYNVNGHSLIYYSNLIASTDATNTIAVALGTTGIKIIAIVNNGASSKIYINSKTAGTTANAGSSTALSLAMGNRQYNPAKWAIGQHYIYTSAHTNTNVGLMLDYLGSLYNVTIS